MPDDSSLRPPLPTKLPPQTVERWRQIVQRAVRNGTDISQLVQHFAERAFENKTVSLDTQGARRRALTQMRQTLTREMTRAKKALAEHTDPKKNVLLRPYQGITLTFVPPVRGAKQGHKSSSAHVVPLALEGDTQASKSLPHKDKLLTTLELADYVNMLAQQGDGIDKEMADIDEVLNRGMHNRDSTVAELSATTQELWRIAQEEVAASHSAASKVPATTPAGATAVSGGAPAAPLPTPMSEEKTAALPEPPTVPAVPPKSDAAPTPSRSQALLNNVQALFKKRS